MIKTGDQTHRHPRMGAESAHTADVETPVLSPLGFSPLPHLLASLCAARPSVVGPVLPVLGTKAVSRLCGGQSGPRANSQLTVDETKTRDGSWAGMKLENILRTRGGGLFCVDRLDNSLSVTLPS